MLRLLRPVEGGLGGRRRDRRVGDRFGGHRIGGVLRGLLHEVADVALGLLGAGGGGLGGVHLAEHVRERREGHAHLAARLQIAADAEHQVGPVDARGQNILARQGRRALVDHLQYVPHGREILRRGGLLQEVDELRPAVIEQPVNLRGEPDLHLLPGAEEHRGFAAVRRREN